MKLLGKRSWLALVAALALPLLVQAEKFGTDENGVEITQTPFSQANTASVGTAVTPMVIKNLDAKRPAEVDIRSAREGFGLRLSRSFTVPPGAQLNVPWFMPIDFIKGSHSGLSNAFEVQVNGKSFDTPLSVNTFGGRGRGAPVVLCSRGANRDLLKSLMQSSVPVASTGHSGSSPEPEFAQSEAEPENWPAYWMAYSAFDLVVLTKAELERVPDAARHQLAGYVETGGWVMVLDGDKLPKNWETATANPQIDNVSGTRTVPVGFGLWTLAPPLPATRPAATPTKFGSWLSERLLHNVRAAYSANTNPWDNGNFRVIDKIRIPVVGIMICIFIFSLLAGPVNILVLDRLKRRVWLLWTTPVLALLFSGILVAYFLFSEGLARHALYQEVSVLNEPAQRVAVLGMNAYYCPLPPDGLLYSADTEVRALDSRDRFSGRIDMTSGTRLQSEWISPRIPANFSIRTSRTAKERLQFSRRGNQLTVMNGLGRPIRQLRVCDAHKQLWQADNVLPGATADLRIGTESLLGRHGSLALFYLDGSWRSDLGDPSPSRQVNSWDWLDTPCRYVAEMDGSTVFLEQGATASDTKVKNVLVLGVAADREMLGGTVENGELKIENGK